MDDDAEWTIVERPIVPFRAACCRHHAVSSVMGLFEESVPDAEKQLDDAFELFQHLDEVFVLDFDDTIVTWSGNVDGKRTVLDIATNSIAPFYGGVLTCHPDAASGVVPTLYEYVRRAPSAGILVLTFGLYPMSTCVLRTRFGDDFFDRHCRIVDRSMMSLLEKPSPFFTKLMLEQKKLGWLQRLDVNFVKPLILRALLEMRQSAGRPPPSKLVFGDDRPDNAAGMRVMLESQRYVPARQWYVIPPQLFCLQTDVCRQVTHEEGANHILRLGRNEDDDSPTGKRIKSQPETQSTTPTSSPRPPRRPVPPIPRRWPDSES